MLSLPFHFFYTIIFLQIKVETIIISLVVGVVADLENKWEDVMGSEKMCGPIIEVDVMGVKEEDLWIHIYRSTFPNEEDH